jgi:hypothetical protein
MILEGWPETSPPPQGPTKTYKMRADESKMRADESRRVTIIIGELGFSSDLGFQKTVDRKQHKYAPLIREQERAGWNVRPKEHVITVGDRATVPIRNVEIHPLSLVLKEPRY